MLMNFGRPASASFNDSLFQAGIEVRLRDLDGASQRRAVFWLHEQKGGFWRVAKNAPPRDVLTAIWRN